MPDNLNSQSRHFLLVPSCGHFLRSLFAQRKRPYEEIDSAIKPLVDRINTVQKLCTIASCHGHWFGKPPYVYFKAPVHIAALIEKQLRECTVNDHPTLNTGWCINGLFDGDYKQSFLLYAPDYHRSASSIFLSIWRFGIHRRRLDAELLALANLVEQAMLTNVGKNCKPEIPDSASYND